MAGRAFAQAVLLLLLPGTAGKEMTRNACWRVIVNDKVEPDDMLDQGSE